MASMHSISSYTWFPLLGICRNIDSLKKVHGLLIVHGLTGELPCDTKLVSMYGSFGYVENARLVFDKIENPDFYSWKVMIRWYFLNDLYEDIIGFFTCLRKCLRECDNVVFSIVLKACCELRNVNEGRKVHCQIVKVGSPDSFVLTALVDIYDCWVRTVWSCELRNVNEGRKVHCQIVKVGSPDSFVLTALVDMYAKCGEELKTQVRLFCSTHGSTSTYMCQVYLNNSYGADRDGLMGEVKPGTSAL
nr:pentatricopeptide repeat-containing protein, mitochondrial [Quercus suber]